MNKGVEVARFGVCVRSRLALLSVAAVLGLMSMGAVASSASAAPVWKAISVSLDHSCAIRFVDGSVVCWGSNKYGQSTPPEGAFTAIASGGFYTCGIRGFTRGEITGRLVCWGKNQYGEASPEPSFSTFFTAAAGSLHTCAITAGDRRPPSGAIKCWGIDTSVIQPPQGKFTSLSAGSNHSCAIRVDGSIACWGEDSHGESSPPAGSFSAVSAGTYDTCAIRSTDHSIVCWGDSSDGQLDAPPGSFVSMASGNEFTCAVRTGDHTIACWGYGVHGETTPPTGAFIPSSEGISAFSSGACAIREGYASIECWGYTSGPPPQAPMGAGLATLTRRAGTVRIESPGGRRFVVLKTTTDAGAGTVVNATAGSVQVIATVHPRHLRALLVRGGAIRLTQVNRGALTVRATAGIATVIDVGARKTIRLRTGQAYTAR